jgi:signal transduction histidine kinase
MRGEPTPVKTRKRCVKVRVPGRSHVLTRSVWGALVVLTLAIVFISLPWYLAQLQTLCAQSCPYQQLTQAQAETLKELGFSLGDYALLTIALVLASVVVCLVVSTVIMLRRSDDRMAVIVALMLVTLGPIIMTADISSLSPWSMPNRWLTFLGQYLIILVFLLFPGGQFVPRFMRWVLVVALVGQAPLLFFPDPSLIPNTSVSSLGWFIALGEMATVVLVQLYRYRRVSSSLQRQQTKWVVFGLVVPITAYVSVTVLGLFPGEASHNPLSVLAFNEAGFLLPLLLPLSFGFAMLRSRLWDIDVLINRTLVYGTLTTIIVGGYALVVSILGTLLHTTANFLISLVATGLIALLFQPLHARLQRSVNRLMYGERDEPYTVLSRLGSRLQAQFSLEALLPTVAQTVAQALKLPYTAIALKQDDDFSIAASCGLAQEKLVILPLVSHRETIGQLRLSPRSPGEAFTAAERRLLEEIARQAGVAIHAVRLTSDLQRSREHLVSTREEERRRLRRDLHDGLGATLAALHLQAGAIRTLMRHDLAAADAEVLDLQAEIRLAIADIRRLVYALRPPTLDELGLVGAIRQYAAQYDLKSAPHEPDECLRVAVEAPDPLPALPAAVEVAAYRIVQEALTNAARHAHARTCTVRLAIDDGFQLSISDDGVGLPAPFGAGVGLLSMRERAAESGGSCLVESTPGCGTRILAHLPLPKE